MVISKKYNYPRIIVNIQTDELKIVMELEDFIFGMKQELLICGVPLQMIEESINNIIKEMKLATIQTLDSVTKPYMVEKQNG